MKTGFDCEKYLTLQYENILKKIDLFDGKLYMEFGGKIFDDLHAERVLPGFQANAKIWVRIPVIAEINDSIEEMQLIKGFLDKNGKPEKIELLPYHAMGENKYSAIRKEAQRFTPPDNNKLNKLKAVF